MTEREHLVGGAVDGGITYEWMPTADKAARLDKELQYAVKAGNHFWVSVAMFHITEESLKNVTTDQVHMDMENLVQIHMGCYLCEEVYDPRTAKRRCKGEPPGELKYV